MPSKKVEDVRKLVKDLHSKIDELHKAAKKNPLVTGKKARSPKGFAENIKRERSLGETKKRAVGTAYGEADKSYKKKRK